MQKGSVGQFPLPLILFALRDLILQPQGGAFMAKLLWGGFSSSLKAQPVGTTAALQPPPSHALLLNSFKGN